MPPRGRLRTPSVHAYGLAVLLGCSDGAGPLARADAARADSRRDGADAAGSSDAAGNGARDASVAIDGPVDPPADAPPADALPADAPIDAPPPLAPPVILYAEGARHSPIDAAIVARLQAIAASASGDARVFAKVGDSITTSTSFLTCFDGGSVDLGGQPQLASTIDHFLAGDAGGTSPFRRASLAAISGASTETIAYGSPSPLMREIAAVDPRFALIMLGTNDLRGGRTFDSFGADLWTIVDQTLASGAIPVLSTIPPNNADGTADARIPTANRFIRAIAQGRQIPLVDYHHEMLALPSRGISSDGIHPSVSPAGACQLDTQGLRYGYNLRNLLAVEALSRARSALAGTAQDGPAAARPGSGRASDPYLATLPLVDLNDTRFGESRLASYPCTTRPQAGAEIVYRIDVASTTTIDAYVVDRGSTDVDVHILQPSLAPTSCIASGDHRATATVSAGPVFVVVDTPAPTSSSEFLLVVQRG